MGPRRGGGTKPRGVSKNAVLLHSDSAPDPSRPPHGLTLESGPDEIMPPPVRRCPIPCAGGSAGERTYTGVPREGRDAGDGWEPVVGGQEGDAHRRGSLDRLRSPTPRSHLLHRRAEAPRPAPAPSTNRSRELARHIVCAPTAPFNSQLGNYLSVPQRRPKAVQPSSEAKPGLCSSALSPAPASKKKKKSGRRA